MNSPAKSLFYAAMFSSLLLSLSLTETATAQTAHQKTDTHHWYGRVSAGITSLEAPRDEFSAQSVFEPSLTLGFVPSGNHALELSIGYLRSETTEEFVAPAPYTISLRAIPIEATYRYRFAFLQVGGFSPLAGLGATWTLTRDTWESDTPAESSSTSVFGGMAFLGVQADVSERIAAVARGLYRGTIDNDERFVQHIGLDGFAGRVGIQVSF